MPARILQNTRKRVSISGFTDDLVNTSVLNVIHVAIAYHC